MSDPFWVSVVDYRDYHDGVYVGTVFAVGDGDCMNATDPGRLHLRYDSERAPRWYGPKPRAGDSALILSGTEAFPLAIVDVVDQFASNILRRAGEDTDTGEDLWNGPG